MSARKAKRTKADGETRYSERWPGDRGNYGWTVSAECHPSGHVGITQSTGGRVLLSPSQARELLRFIRPVPVKRRKARKKA